MNSQEARRLRHVHRIRGLQALLLRQQIEGALASNPAQASQWSTLLKRLDGVLDEVVQAAIEPQESALLGAPWGAFAESDRVFAAWRIEHLAVLLWATTLLPDLPASSPADEDAVASALPLFVDEDTLVARLKWRGPDEIAASQREHALWKWRTDVEWGHRNGAKPPTAQPFAAFVAERVDRMPRSLLRVGEGAALDLAVEGVGVAALPRGTLETLRCAHHERAAAFAWIGA